MKNDKLIKDKALLKKMYESVGRLDHYIKNIEPNIKSSQDFENEVSKSFAPETQVQFDGTLQQNEFVNALFNIYTQITLNTIKGEIPYIDVWLKDAPFSGSKGYLSQGLKVGQAFSQEFQTSDFNPEERPAHLQVISTALRRRFSDSLSMEVISRGASNEGGLVKYMQDRIALLSEDYIAFIREYILIAIDNIKGKELTINVPVELQSITMLEQRARYILQNMVNELKYISDNSTEYTDTGFTSRTPKNELIAIWDRSASSEMEVQAMGMLRNPKVMKGITVGKEVDVPMTYIEDKFYAKFTVPRKIHYSKSLNVAAMDNLGVNLKKVYSHHYFVELDIVDAEPALTVYVNDSTESYSSKDFVSHTVKNTKDIIKELGIGKLVKKEYNFIDKKLLISKTRRENMNAKILKSIKDKDSKLNKKMKELVSATIAPTPLVGNDIKEED